MPVPDIEVIRLDVFEPRFDGALAPVVLFSVAASKRGLIEKPHIVKSGPAHRHAKSNTRRHLAIYGGKPSKKGVDLIDVHAYGQVIITAEVGETTDSSAVSKGSDAAHGLIFPDWRHKSLEPTLGSHHVGVDNNNIPRDARSPLLTETTKPSFFSLSIRTDPGHDARYFLSAGRTRSSGEQSSTTMILWGTLVLFMLSNKSPRYW